MTRATGSQVALGYKVEVTPGTTPAGDWNGIRKNSDSLSAPSDNISSGEIRDDRENASDIQGNKNMSGQVVSELSADSHDEFIKGALFSDADWTTATISAATISAAAADNSLNDSGSGFVAAGFIPGMWAYLSGFTGGNSAGGWVKCVSVDTGKIVLAGITLVDESVGDTVTLEGKYVKGGKTSIYYSLLKRMTDISKEIIFDGCLISQMAVSVQPNQVVSINFTFNGRNDTPQAQSGDAVTAAPTTDPMDSFSGTLLVDDVEDQNITSINFTVENNVSDMFVIGTRYKIDQSAGRRDVNGSISAYFEDLDEYIASQAHTSRKLDITFTDGTDYYAIDMPRCYFDYAAPPTEGEGPMTLTGDLRSRLEGETHNASIIISRTS